MYPHLKVCVKVRTIMIMLKNPLLEEIKMIKIKTNIIMIKRFQDTKTIRIMIILEMQHQCKDMKMKRVTLIMCLINSHQILASIIQGTFLDDLSKCYQIYPPNFETPKFRTPKNTTKIIRKNGNLGKNLKTSKMMMIILIETGQEVQMSEINQWMRVWALQIYANRNNYHPKQSLML